MGISRDCPIFSGTVHPIISGTGKATHFKFGQYIHRVHPNKSPLKILEKRASGYIQGLPNFFGYPRLSQARVKLRNSNCACTFIGSIGTKPIKNFRKSRREHSQGLPKIFRSLIHMAHRAVIFEIAQLSCKDWNNLTATGAGILKGAGGDSNSMLMLWITSPKRVCCYLMV